MKTKGELEREGFEPIGEVCTYSGYDWGAFVVWKKAHQLFYDTDSGCSCNYPWDDGYDLSLVTLDDLRRKIRGYVDPEDLDKAEALIRKIEKVAK